MTYQKQTHMKEWLMKIPSKKWKHYFFVLSTRVFHPISESSTRSILLEYFYDSTLTNKKATIDISDCTEVNSNVRLGGVSNVFSLVGFIGGHKKTLFLSASDEVMMEEWVRKIRGVLEIKNDLTEFVNKKTVKKNNSKNDLECSNRNTDSNRTTDVTLKLKKNKEKTKDEVVKTIPSYDFIKIGRKKVKKNTVTFGLVPETMYVKQNNACQTTNSNFNKAATGNSKTDIDCKFHGNSCFCVFCHCLKCMQQLKHDNSQQQVPHQRQPRYVHHLSNHHNIHHHPHCQPPFTSRCHHTSHHHHHDHHH